jgi:hypothetical protein
MVNCTALHRELIYFYSKLTYHIIQHCANGNLAISTGSFAGCIQTHATIKIHLAD